jgi:hypothetical protein
MTLTVPAETPLYLTCDTSSKKSCMVSDSPTWRGKSCCTITLVNILSNLCFADPVNSLGFGPPLHTLQQILHHVTSCHGVRFLRCEQFQEVRWILVSTHCVLQVPDHHIQFSMTLQKVGLDDLRTSVVYDQNFLAVDMSPNLVLSSNVTTVVPSGAARGGPFHYPPPHLKHPRLRNIHLRVKRKKEPPLRDVIQ